ncbi:NAC domain-containing protein 75 [Camellia lanceoleosa]|uniref:NAC domain-containing protein 75 n=1 Tax=Camellia lanceoleosa TaxID=1840588 RepID=A0ACC0IFG9_9ERIC|nr:NAC domain-containing protein 75 [Camellia lanceoleosa]
MLQRPRHAIHEQQQHQHHQIASTAFHISRPSLPISTIISSPPLHHTSIILDEDSFHVSRIMLQNENFQENDKKDETVADSASKKVDSDSEEEEQDTHQKEKGVSNKKKKV